MATQGWSGIAPDDVLALTRAAAPAPKKPHRRTLAQIGEEQVEADVQRGIVEWCDRMGLLVHHSHRPQHDRRGFPDLVIGTMPPCAIEVKHPHGTGRLSREQERWLIAWGDRGCVVTSAEEGIAFVRRMMGRERG